MSGKLFISYSHDDSAFVRQLSVYLSQEDIPPWVDNQLEFGESWQEVIVERLLRCVAFLVLMSPNSAESAFVREEIELAKNKHKVILPILLAGKPFDSMNNLHWVDMRKPNWPNYRLIERIRDLVDPGHIPALAVQRRRMELFVCMAFRQLLCINTPIVTFGVGFDANYGIDPAQNLGALGLDEIDWAELLLMLNDQLPGRDFSLTKDDYKGSRFARLSDLVDHLLGTIDWKDLRRFDFRFE